MIRRPPRSTRTDTLFPYTTLVRSKMCGIAGRSGIIGREQTRITEPLVHQPQIEGAGADIVARIMRIRAEVEPAAHIGIAGGHELHQPHRTRAAGDRPAIEHGVAAAFGAHDGDDPGFRSEEHTSELQSLMRNSYA